MHWELLHQKEVRVKDTDLAFGFERSPMESKLFHVSAMHGFGTRVLRGFLCLVFLLVLPGIDSIVFASEEKETPQPTSSIVSAFQKEETVRLSKYLSLGIKGKRLVNSHTSYEFGNPFPPYQAPLSRLEFPLDTWWVGGELRASFLRFSAGIEALQSARGDADGHMYDSDWEDGGNPSRKTTYSVSRSRMEPSYMVRADVDMEVSDWLGLAQWLSLRPVVGTRYQHFRMVVHDGVQYDLWEGKPPQLLSGDSIRFKQTYWQYFIGVRSGIDVGRYTGIPDLRLTAQFDWAYVEGSNEDKHLLRAGERFTYDDTNGHAWHTLIGLKKGLWRNFFLGADFDYLRIDTTGSHRLVNRPFCVDMSFSNGVKVWSEQKSVSLSLEYRF